MKIVDVKTFVVGNPPPHFGGRYFVFLKLITDGGIEGVGEVYGPVSSRRRRAHDRGRLRAPRHRRRPVQDRAPVADRLLERLHPAPGHLAGRRPERHRDGLLGHRRQGAGPAGLRAARRPGPREAALLHLPLSGGGRPDRRLPRSGSRGGAGGRIRRAGFTAVKFDPVGPYSAFDPRQLSLEALEHTERFVRTLREAVGAAAICCSGPTAR